MPKIRIIGNGRAGAQLGDVYETSEHEAEALIDAGSAELVKDEKKSTRVVEPMETRDK